MGILTEGEFGKFTNTYTSFSGADIVATFGGQNVGTLSGITWSITREKAPIYTMGSPNPRSFTRGKRGLAGALVFTMFDRPSLYEMLANAEPRESIKYFTRSSNVLPGYGTGYEHRGISPVSEQSLDVVSALPYYADQIPPFDISITFLNEYGQSAVRNLYGVELLNEGSGASMDDVVIEETMTYVARDIGPMLATKQGNQPGFTDLELDTDIVLPS